VPKFVVAIGGERGATGCICPSGADTAGIGGAAGTSGGGVGAVDNAPEFNSNNTAPALEAGGSADFGAVETADRSEPVDPTAPTALVDCCGKRIGAPCWPRNAGATRTAEDPVNPARALALPPREPPRAVAESIVSANVARAATRISDGLRSVHVNMVARSITSSASLRPESGALQGADAPRRRRRTAHTQRGLADHRPCKDQLDLRHLDRRPVQWKSCSVH
jgi:hypothetical protein